MSTSSTPSNTITATVFSIMAGTRGGGGLSARGQDLHPHALHFLRRRRARRVATLIEGYTHGDAVLRDRRGGHGNGVRAGGRANANSLWREDAGRLARRRLALHLPSPSRRPPG